MKPRRAPQILDGPRGRRLFLKLAQMLCEEAALLAWDPTAQLEPQRGTWQMAPLLEALPDAATAPQELREAQEASVPALISAIDRVPLGSLTPASTQEAFCAAVNAAWYWQEPSGQDVLAADPGVRAAPRRLVLELTAMPELNWWSRDAIEQQRRRRSMRCI